MTHVPEIGARKMWSGFMELVSGPCVMGITPRRTDALQSDGGKLLGGKMKCDNTSVSN